VLAAATVPGLYLVWRGGALLAVLGLLAIIAAVTYTAGPKPFGYLGLGEFFVFLFFGPVAVVGTAYAMIHVATPTGIMASIPMGCLVTAILVVNNLRDIDTDREAGKRTLAVRIGTDGSRWEYASLMIVAYATPVMMWLTGTTGAWPITALVTAPLALMLVRQVWSVSGRGLNAVLAGTARLCLWVAVALSVGIVL
jgi:1,4-dihydroxy-2-naphthoate octaprenyltransferase